MLEWLFDIKEWLAERRFIFRLKRDKEFQARLHKAMQARKAGETKPLSQVMEELRIQEERLYYCLDPKCKGQNEPQAQQRGGRRCAEGDEPVRTSMDSGAS